MCTYGNPRAKKSVKNIVSSEETKVKKRKKLLKK
tara:strand:- start:113 stop:214 length:102 start_codon:yes stop_codon:yes gene_type:complete